MKLRTQFLLAFVLVLAAAALSTDLTYRVAYGPLGAWLSGYYARSPQAANLVMALAVPFAWVVFWMFVAAWALGRRFNQPLRELAAAVEQMKGRDLSFRLTYDRKDELGDLCRAFAGMQQELKAALDREWREQESRREMMAAIAHDLRTPLTLVRGHAEALLAAPQERRLERLERYLSAIAAGAQRASAMLDDLLTIARLQAADFRLEPRRVDLVQELSAWAREYAVMARAQAVAFRWDAPPEERVEAWADPDRLHQVLDNLVANALRHTPAGGAVTLSLRQAEGEALVTVADTGPGFAAADLPHLFDRHFQGGEGAVGAAGLGLYICRLLVERHGGRIRAGNRPGGGAVVSFLLPAAVNNVTESAPRSEVSAWE